MIPNDPPLWKRGVRGDLKVTMLRYKEIFNNTQGVPERIWGYL
jgi:hypothetical protein